MLARKALAGTAGAPKLYVEDVYSTYLYTGTGSTLSINNGISLSTEGGLVWLKRRGVTGNHFLYDSARAVPNRLWTNSTAAQNTSETDTLTSFNSNGFSLGADATAWGVNVSGNTMASFTFRKAKKFFDVVTYTGTGSARSVSHNLGSTPGCIIIKCTSNADSWIVYHRSTGTSKFLYLNTTDAEQTYSWISSVGSASFTLNDDSSLYNTNGRTYVAYLFAHDAGGFGDAGSDSIIKCDTFTTDGSGNSPTVNLGWEPQWLLVKQSGASGSWYIIDTMRGWNNAPSGSTSALTLYPNLSNAEAGAAYWNPTSTGFYLGSVGNANTAFIYIAIRRGPMKTPTSGTSVYNAIARNGTGAAANITGVGFAPDLVWAKSRSNAIGYDCVDKLRGANQMLYPYLTNAEITDADAVTAFGMDGISVGTDASQGGINASYPPYTYINQFFRRAPGFFDVVCYTGTGSATTISHNLGVAPELMIVKRRNTTNAWAVYANNDNTDYLVLNTTAATVDDNTYWNDTSPTSSVFSVGTNNATNASGSTYVAYLFASLSGVSKVGSYTGNGSSVTVTTNFQPRFILVKRTDSTGNWIVGDSARGLIAGNDPYLLLNSTAAEDTDEDWVDVSSTGFTVNETSAANANVNTGTYIYLAVS